MFTRTKAINKLFDLKKRKKVVQGGTWAGKTQGIIAVLINELTQNPAMDLTVVGESVPALKGGALKIFKSIMQDTGRWCDDHYNATDRLYRFANGAQVNFQSFDTIGKAKAAGKRTHLFINEAQYVPFLIAYELMIRSDWTWIDYNPNNPFWVHEEIIPEEDTDFIILTYKDNETTPDHKIKEFNRNRERAKTSKYWDNWCRVYIDGEIGSLEGVIFQNWTIIDRIPEGAETLGYGMDFGYTNDPSTLIGLHKHNNKRIYDEVLYQRGLKTHELARITKEAIDPHSWVYGDGSNPRLIDEIGEYGINIKGAWNGKGSIQLGIAIIQEEHFYVTARSINLIRELREYCWGTDKEGNLTGEPIGTFNHCIDDMRYVSYEKLSKSQKTRSAPMITLPKFH